MKRLSLNFGWDFKGSFRDPIEKVDLPHDYIVTKERKPEIGPATGFFPGGDGTYEKELEPSEELRGKTIILNLDGAYMNTEITLNGHLLAMHPYGYTPFQLDITDKFRFDITNKLKITTANSLKNSRWYSGSGIYRDVTLLVGGRQYINPWGLRVTTPHIEKDYARVCVETEIDNKDSVELRGVLELSVYYGDECVACGSYPTAMPAAEKTRVRHNIIVDDPKLWDVDDPNLYKLCFVLRSEDGVELDSGDTRFGIREIEIDSKNGFRLNGKKMKLRGGCIHHDHGMLGAAAFRDAEMRKASILKSCGYNALRIAHNPASTALLDACDELGILVLEESFDMWRISKNSQDYHLYFEAWWKRDTESMVLRDRNHPCIYAWSIGNEINELLGLADGAHLTRMQADLVRSLDNRPVSASANDFPAELPDVVIDKTQLMGEEYAPDGHKILGVPLKNDVWDRQTLSSIQSLDLFGYNYMYGRYKYDAVRHPDRVIHATESHPFYTYDYWQAALENDNCIGDFIWTAYDNMGEAGFGRPIYGEVSSEFVALGLWPWLTCWQGDCDLTGRRRPQSYYRKIMWGFDNGIHLFSLHPKFTGKELHGSFWHWDDIKPDWSYGEEWYGKPSKLVAYADCDEIEFEVNGNAQRVPVSRLMAELTVDYQPGKVIARAIKDGKIVAEDVIQTNEGELKLKITPERDTIAADGMSLAYIDVALQDANGVDVIESDCEVTVSVSGAAKFMGIGSGNPCTDENYTDHRRLFNGHALICVRSGLESGEAVIKVTSKYGDCETTVNVKKK